MKDKIVVLNSGGYDSACLMHYLRYGIEEEYEIHSLHFLYGAKNEKQQEECVDKVCKKIGAVNRKITIPTFDWTNSEFFNEGYEFKSQYLEYRNLIFLSYALSYAESIGAKKIYVATLKSSGSYPDTTPTFFKGINSFSKPLTNIEVLTPFSDFDKIDLIPFATQGLLRNDEYFSCDVPNEDGSPCGKCMDCKALEVPKSALEENHHFRRYLNTKGDLKDNKFRELLTSSGIRELRVLHNNSCQLNCSHCFYGFEDTVSPILPKEEIYGAIVQASELGVENIHFSGKEPLFDDEILWYARKIKEDKLPITFNLVSNGINVPKYIKELKECGLEKLYLSVDEVLSTNGVRSVHNVCDKAISATIECGVPLEIFIDLHNNNYDRIYDIVVSLLTKYPKGIGSFYLRTIRSLGNASNGENLLTAERLDKVFLQLCSLADKYQDVFFDLSMGIENENEVFKTKHLSEALNILDLYRTHLYYDNFSFMLESYCTRYDINITLTPDGYLLGCASEVSAPNYNELSVGNIKDHSLEELIKLGKEKLKTVNDVYCGKCDKKCSFLM